MIALATALSGSGAATAQKKPDTSGMETHAIEVRARPIQRFSRGGADKGAKLSPRLEWRGGLVLSSPSRYFGGWSGLALAGDGKSFVAVSDAGAWMTGKIAYDASGKPEDLRDTRIGALLNRKGGPLARERERDAEALALAGGTPSNGTAYIAFEQVDRIGLFKIEKGRLGKPSSYLKMPREAARMRMDGIEALTVLAGGPRKGALVAFAEHPLRGEDVHRGWIWLSDTPRGFTVAGIEGFGITDAASLPDGSVLVLERRFRWLEGLRVRLRQIDAGSIGPGSVAKGKVLLEANHASSEIDNLEALAVSTGEDGETVLTLMSDDNYNRFLQRTVLLQFTLHEEAVAEASGAAKAKGPPAAQ
ncbi:esterase-like activity of phytase family protein [Hyphomicrobium sp. CS1GBMeth3]|uniref:esterase-like activity of phytase family protein n=1 Tax=Hyphomicrobium sp. CS1GBMeth3 TaxID=1892845 RepID=UPI001FCD787D|nr:esterase-like activity of phytase family protein [Hyphomicrobium sp. CS1GBMeth3]